MAKTHDDPTKTKWRIPNSVELAAWMRAHRAKIHLSQRELAQLACVSRSSVWRIENCATDRKDQKIPSIDLAHRLWSIVRAMETGNLNFAKRVLIRAERAKRGR